MKKACNNCVHGHCMLNKFKDFPCNKCDDERMWESDVDDIRNQIAALKTALQFYADPATHKHVITTENGIEIPIINDNGEIARAALDGWSSGEIRELKDGEK